MTAQRSQRVAHSASELHFINNSINEWRRCLKYVVQQNGGHTEHFSI